MSKRAKPTRAEPGNVTARMQHLVATIHGMVCERIRPARPKDLQVSQPPAVGR